MYNTKSEAWSKVRTVVIMMCQPGFTNLTKTCPLVMGVDNGGGDACGGRGYVGKPLYLPLSFAVDLKPPLKNKVFKKINHLRISF